MVRPPEWWEQRIRSLHELGAEGLEGFRRAGDGGRADPDELASAEETDGGAGGLAEPAGPDSTPPGAHATDSAAPAALASGLAPAGGQPGRGAARPSLRLVGRVPPPSRGERLVAELVEAMRAVADRSCGSYRRTLGDAGFEEVVEEKAFALLPALLTLANPRGAEAFVRTAMCRALRDAARRRSAGPGQVPPNIPGGVLPEQAPSEPTLGPRLVGETFGSVAGFVAVALQLLRMGNTAVSGGGSPWRAAETAEAAARAAAEAAASLVTSWTDLKGYLDRDVGLGAGRLRWQHVPRESGGRPGGVPTATDNGARAWQAVYHRHEENDGFTEPSEMPLEPRSPAGAAFYQHLSRFRKTYWAAVGVGSGIVEGRGALPRDPGRGIPHEWTEWYDHPTLSAHYTPRERQAGAGAAEEE